MKKSGTTVKDICDYLETLAPLQYQEDYDNCGLIVGEPSTKVSQALITLDCTEAVVDEAIQRSCQLIIAHHPIVFRGLKKLNGKNYVERVVMKALRARIAIYAIHTNLDNVRHGVNDMICEKLGLENRRVLSPKVDILCKLVTFVPRKNLEAVADAVYAAGAGQIGNYSETSFSTSGIGTFRGNENSHPTIGKAGKLEQVSEERFETIFPIHAKTSVINALLKAHPYEEVAYDIIPLQNSFAQVGSGMIGQLAKPMNELSFLKLVKKTFGSGCLRHTALLGQSVKTVAVCGGSGSFLLADAIRQQADVFITADFKYHEFFDAENKVLIADIGHYESEQYTIQLLHRSLVGKFSMFAPLQSKINTNPVKYL